MKEKKEESQKSSLVVKIFDFLAAHYEHSWGKGLEEISYESKLNAWSQSMEGLTQRQVEYAQQKISSGQAHIEFPPNPGQFRLLCKSMPDDLKTKPWVKSPNDKTPSPSEKFNPEYDIAWFCGLQPEEKETVYDGAIKAWPLLKGILIMNKESVKDIGFEKSAWLKPMIESFRSYYRL